MKIKGLIYLFNKSSIPLFCTYPSQAIPRSLLNNILSSPPGPEFQSPLVWCLSFWWTLCINGTTDYATVCETLCISSTRKRDASMAGSTYKCFSHSTLSAFPTKCTATGKAKETASELQKRMGIILGGPLCWLNDKNQMLNNW